MLRRLHGLRRRLQGGAFVPTRCPSASWCLHEQRHAVAQECRDGASSSAEHLGALEALLRALGQGLEHGPVDVRGHELLGELRRRRRHQAGVRGQELEHVTRIVERAPAGDERAEKQPGGVHVGPRVDRLEARLLRRDCPGAPHEHTLFRRVLRADGEGDASHCTSFAMPKSSTLTIGAPPSVDAQRKTLSALTSRWTMPS